MKTHLKYLAFMVPGIAVSGFLSGFFIQQSLATIMGVSLFVIFNVVNLLACHTLLVPSKIKDQLKGKYTGRDSKKLLGQSFYNGFSHSELVKRYQQSSIKFFRYHNLHNFLDTCVFLYIISLFILGFTENETIFSSYMLWIFGMLLFVFRSIIYQKRNYSFLLKETLFRCAEKCNITGSKVYVDDGSIL